MSAKEQLITIDEAAKRSKMKPTGFRSVIHKKGITTYEFGPRVRRVNWPEVLSKVKKIR